MLGEDHAIFDRLPVLVLVPHTDAGDRQAWTLDQQLRPLSDAGRVQASALADIVGVVDAVFSSPALRCVETVEPIAARSGVDVEIDDDLRELTYVTEHETWDAWTSDEGWRGQLLAAAGLGRVAAAMSRIADRHPSGRVVVGAHGDLVPLFALLAAGYFHVAGPPPIARGGCFEIDPTNRRSPIRSLGTLATPRS